MPFKSQAQRAYMHIHHPRIADRWEDHTPKGKKLPKHVPGSEATEKKSAFYGHGVAQAMLDVGMVKMNEDKIPGGLADNKKPSDFAADALAQGRKVEREHTSDSGIANEIAMDHLTEDKNYYAKLKKMEKESVAKAAAFLKQAWPWSRGGQGVSTVAQNYHPDTVARAQQAERGQPMTTPRPNLPPQTMGPGGVPQSFGPGPSQRAPSVPTPSPMPAGGSDPLRGTVGQQRNALALNAQNWR